MNRRDIEARMRASNVPDDVIEQFMKDDEQLCNAINAGRCPNCDGPINRRVDPRQAGAEFIDGTWINYRCSCGYMMDRKE